MAMTKLTTYISNEIIEFYYYIFDNFLTEDLKKKIKKHEKEILRESFQRGFLNFFRNKENSNYSIVSEKKRKNITSGFFEEVLAVQPSVFSLESKDSHEEKKIKKVESKSKKENEIILQNKIIKTIKPNAIVKMNCNYDFKFRALSFKFLSIDITYPGKTERRYLQELKEEFESAKAKFESGYNKALFLKNFFDTLAANGYTVIDGRDASFMKEIYPNISTHYPEFEKISKEKQIHVLQQAALKGRIEPKKDVHTFAYATFFELMKANCINTVIAFDQNSGKVLEYKKEKEYYEKVYDKQKKCYVENKKRLLFITYKRPEYLTSFHAHTLWNMLVKSRISEEEYF